MNFQIKDYREFFPFGYQVLSFLSLGLEKVENLLSLCFSDIELSSLNPEIATQDSGVHLLFVYGTLKKGFHWNQK